MKPSKKRAQRASAPPPAGYSGTPLPKKLGIKPEMVVALVSSPADFELTLGPLPEGVRLSSGRGPRGLTVLFVRSQDELERKLEGLLGVLGDGGLWIAWPKRSSGIPTDVTEDTVRDAGLSRGLVDHKVCAIDATWSGLRFARRKSGAPN
jgi:hypothetical protein